LPPPAHEAGFAPPQPAAARGLMTPDSSATDLFVRTRTNPTNGATEPKPPSPLECRAR